VRISDAALVAAATLSHRYITDRFLPDKAIDLMDEASSRLRMEVDSKPEELDALDRQILQMQIEAEALKKEDDAASKDRLEKLEKELSDLQQQSAEMTAKWQAERDKLDAARNLQEKLDHARAELDQAKRAGRSGQGRGAVLRRDPAAGEGAGRGRGNRTATSWSTRPCGPSRSPRWSSAGPACRWPRCWRARRKSSSAWKRSWASA
jgi:plasmid stabilization system protein ParE